MFSRNLIQIMLPVKINIFFMKSVQKSTKYKDDKKFAKKILSGKNSSQKKNSPTQQKRNCFRTNE